MITRLHQRPKGVEARTIALKDLSPTAVDVLRGVAGSAGPQGPQGPAGVVGVSGYEMLQATSPAAASGAVASVSATCPAGKRIVGATAYWELSDAAVQVVPGGGSSTTSWAARDVSPGGSADKTASRVVCLNAG